MTTQQKLANWLATKKLDYKTGVQIFIDLNIDVKKVDFFSSGSDKIHQNILFRQLENYARVHKIKPKIFIEKPPVHQKRDKLKAQQKPKAVQDQTTSKIERPLIDTNPSVKFDELPADLQELFKENSNKNAEIKTMHAELKLIQEDPDKEERRKYLAQGIIENQKVIRANWDTIDKWWNSRNSDETKDENKSSEEKAAEEALKKEKRIRANLNYIRRYKNTTKPKQKEELAFRMKELDQWKINYEELLK
jgi:hypothetical protein